MVSWKEICLDTNMTRNLLGRQGGQRIPSGEISYVKPLRHESLEPLRSMSRNC